MGAPRERHRARTQVLQAFGWGPLGRAGRLTAKGTVPGIDETTFTMAAENAKDGCPISDALKGNVELSVEATLT